MAFSLEDAVPCSFMSCIKPAIITFIVTVLVLLGINLYLYFKFVKYAEKKFGNAESIELFKTSQYDAAYQDPYVGVSDLDDTVETDVWQMYLNDKQRQIDAANFGFAPKPLMHVERKYLPYLSRKFLLSKGYTDSEIRQYHQMISNGS